MKITKSVIYLHFVIIHIAFLYGLGSITVTTNYSRTSIVLLKPKELQWIPNKITSTLI